MRWSRSQLFAHLEFFSRSGKNAKESAATFSSGNSIELVGMMQTRAVLSEEAAEDAESEAADDVADEELAEETREPAVEYVDRIAHNMALVKDVFGLTTREAEVADLLARGETVARIAAALFISENTVRMHSKHIYTKLDVHKKQQLLC